jgi:hypothetical protein
MITRTGRLSVPRTCFLGVLAVLAVLWVLVAGCSKDIKANSDNNDAGDTDSDSDSDTDTDADTDSDSDTDTDVDADSDSDADAGSDSDTDTDTDADTDTNSDSAGMCDPPTSNPATACEPSTNCCDFPYEGGETSYGEGMDNCSASWSTSEGGYLVECSDLSSLEPYCECSVA